MGSIHGFPKWCALLILGTLALCGVALADGEPSDSVVSSGMLIPINDHSTHVLSQRIDVLLPKPPRPDYADLQPAEIRVRYLVSSQGKKGNAPRTIEIAWPTGGISQDANKSPRTEFPVKITLDGNIVPFKFLMRDDLMEPYVRGWLKQMDDLLTSKPTLKSKVLEVRKMLPAPSSDWGYVVKSRELAEQFGKWMVEHGQIKQTDRDRLAAIAGGLLGMRQYYDNVQDALCWLDPHYEPVDIDEELTERWGYSRLMLDPYTHWVTEETDDIASGRFAVIRFDITLKPGVPHELNVTYKQWLSVIQPGPWFGLTYFMEPARRWGRWDKTTINVIAPNSWDKVIVRPTPSSSRKTDTQRTMTIDMLGRPHEDLYISLIPPQEENTGAKKP